MNTYHKFIQCLKKAAENAGGKVRLYEMLDTSKPTFYKALSDSDPTLPATKVLCRWCDALNIDIVMPGEECFDYVALPKISKYQLDNIDSANEVDKRFLFPRKWFEKHEIDQLKCVIVSDLELGKSISKGDDVLIDTSKNTLKDGGIFVTAVDKGEILLRRCQYIPGAMQLWVDDCPPIYYVDGETRGVNIYGQVLWTGRFTFDQM